MDRNKLPVNPKRGRPPGKRRPLNEHEKKARNAAYEQQRRESLSETFGQLRDLVELPENASRAQILKKAAEYIQFMSRKNNSHRIDDLKRQNSIIETQIRMLEKAKATGQYMDPHELGLKSEGSSHDTDSSDGEGTTRRRVKKLKIGANNKTSPLYACRKSGFRLDKYESRQSWSQIL